VRIWPGSAWKRDSSSRRPCPIENTGGDDEILDEVYQLSRFGSRCLDIGPRAVEQSFRFVSIPEVGIQNCSAAPRSRAPARIVTKRICARTMEVNRERFDVAESAKSRGGRPFVEK